MLTSRRPRHGRRGRDTGTGKFRINVLEAGRGWVKWKFTDGFQLLCRWAVAEETGWAAKRNRPTIRGRANPRGSEDSCQVSPEQPGSCWLTSVRSSAGGYSKFSMKAFAARRMERHQAQAR